MTTRSSDRTPDSKRTTTGAQAMRAIVQDEYGSAAEDVLRLAKVARPVIADDEVLIRVRAASVDRGTWHVMAGLPYPIRDARFGLRRPKALNPGRSVAGTVASAGRGAIDGTFALGETAAAIRHVVEGRARGKVVISPIVG
jgi:NADPH:quinone reductase-like Zn-dependent oxidoreductase